jgi:peptide deformylase
MSEHKCNGRALPLVTYPDKRLKQKSVRVEKVDASVQKDLDELIHGVQHYSGVGLSGVQLGIMKDVFVVDVDYCLRRDPEASKVDNPEVKGICSFINTEIIQASDESATYKEGCLSLPGLDFPDVERPAEVKVKFLDYNGKEQMATVRGLLAACIQHEKDHCEGILVLDHLSPLKKQVQIRKLEKYIRLHSES